MSPAAGSTSHLLSLGIGFPYSPNCTSPLERAFVSFKAASRKNSLPAGKHGGCGDMRSRAEVHEGSPQWPGGRCSDQTPCSQPVLPRWTGGAIGCTGGCRCPVAIAPIMGHPVVSSGSGGLISSGSSSACVPRVPTWPVP